MLFTPDQWQREEALRIPYCRQASPEMSLIELCRYYNLNIDQAAQVLREQTAQVTVAARKRRITSDTARAYAKANMFQEVNARTLADALDVSVPTAYKFIEGNPDCFRQLKRGTWECRDAQADRQAEKGK
jgi:hypothetical protein